MFYQLITTIITTRSDSAATHGADSTFLLPFMKGNNYFKNCSLLEIFFNRNVLSSTPIQAVTILTFIWDVTRSDVGPDTDYPDRGF